MTVYDALSNVPGLTVNRPQGAMYIMVRRPHRQLPFVVIFR